MFDEKLFFGDGADPVVPKTATPVPLTQSVAPAAKETAPAVGSPAVPVLPTQVQQAPTTGGKWKDVLNTILLCAVIAMGVLWWRSTWKQSDDGSSQDGLHVLVVYESSADDDDRSYDQKLAMSSLEVREWLDKNCAEDGGSPAWRMFDKDVDLQNDLPVWKQLMSKKRDGLPWLYMTGGKREVSEPVVDGSVSEFIEQLEKGK